MTKKEQALEYLKVVILPLCSYPIQLKDVVDERGLVITIIAHEKDLPFLIGRKGIIANSLRNILHIWGTKNYAAVKLFINKSA